MTAFFQGIHVLAVALIAGAFLFALAMPLPAGMEAAKTANVMPKVECAVGRLAAYGLAAAMVTALLWLWAVTSGTSGLGLADPALIPAAARVVTDTSFGQLWLWRLAGAIGLALLLAGPARRIGGRAGLALASLLALGLLASIAGMGHAAAAPDRALEIAVQAAHLVAAGVWFGGLTALCIALKLAGDVPDSAGFGVWATKRVGAMAFLAVAVIAASGAICAVFRVAEPAAVLTSNYGTLLIVKSVLFAGALMFAAINRWRVVPLLTAVSGDARAAQGAQRVLARNVGIETILVGAILLLAGWLAVTPPPHG
ncbi:MAG TPA: CopD family protein, partial [Rhodospirillales bacterium]